MAVCAHWVALGVIAIMPPFLNWDWPVLYRMALLGLLALNGWVGRHVGRSRTKLFVLFLNLAVMTFAPVYPSPFDKRSWPDTIVYEYQIFLYFFTILAAGTLAYSHRTIFAIGMWTLVMWLFAVGSMWRFGHTVPELTTGAQRAFSGFDPGIAFLFDPNRVHFDRRIQRSVRLSDCGCHARDRGSTVQSIVARVARHRGA